MKLKEIREFIEKPEVSGYGAFSFVPVELADGSWAWMVADNSFDSRYYLGGYAVTNLPGRGSALNDLIDNIEIAEEK